MGIIRRFIDFYNSENNLKNGLYYSERDVSDAKNQPIRDYSSYGVSDAKSQPKGYAYNSERGKDIRDYSSYGVSDAKNQPKGYAYNSELGKDIRDYSSYGVSDAKNQSQNYAYYAEREDGRERRGTAELRSEPPQKPPRAKKSGLYLKDAFSAANGGLSEKGTRENDLLFEGGAKRKKPLLYDELSNINMYYPRCFEDIVRLVDSVKQKEAVIVELCYLGGDMSQKMLDFMSGAIYALNGSMQRITGSAFLFAPSFVRITNNG